MDDKKIEWNRLHFYQFDENNPKDHNIGEIENSIKRFGFIELPVVNKTTGTLVVGHGRITALQNMASRNENLPKYLRIEEDTKEWLVPTIIVEFETDAEAKAYLIASNQLVIDGSWNEVALYDLLNEVNTLTDGLIGTGFDLEDMQQMLEFQDSKQMFDEDFGKEIYKVVVQAADMAQAEEIKYALGEIGYECQIKTITK